MSLASCRKASNMQSRVNCAKRPEHGKTAFCYPLQAVGEAMDGMAQLDPSLYGTHSLRRTRIAYIYKKTGNIKAAQVLLGHKSIENTAKYLGIEEEEALNIAEQFVI